MIRLPAFAGLALLVTANAATATGLRLTSPDLTAGDPIARPYVYANNGCGGGNHSPALRWSGSPENTKSFAITVHDPDAPSPGGWWHWVAYGIATEVHGLPRRASGNAMPEGAIELDNDFGVTGYGGPCPPAGDSPHRYVFTLYALDTAELYLSEATEPAEAAAAIAKHAITSAKLVRRYGR